MKKAVNIYLSLIDTKQKLDLIKSVGYDGVLLTTHDINETMSLEEAIKYCNEIGLEISMVHCTYDSKILNELWQESSNVGDEIIDNLISQVERIKNFNISNFVIHTCGNKHAINSPAGLKRIKKLLTICEKYKINLCVENLFLDNQVKYIFNNLKSPYLKFCFDSGHENFLTPNSELAVIFANILSTTHIHDNHGESDEHLILGLGNINQNKLAKDLSKSSSEFLTAEIKYKGQVLSDEELIEKLKLNLKALNKLDKMIEKFK